jgi:hypothetical protein
MRYTVILEHGEMSWVLTFPIFPVASRSAKPGKMPSSSSERRSSSTFRAWRKKDCLFQSHEVKARSLRSAPPNSRLQRTPAAQARLGADEPQGR